MVSLLFNKTALISIGAIGMSMPLILFLKTRLSLNSDEEHEDNLNIEEAMFFSDEGSSCRDHFRHGKNALKLSESCSSENCPFKNLSRMLRFLQDAKESLDVCIYLLTVKDLSDQIVKAHNRGLKVRVVTDEDMSKGSGSQINRIRQAGIEVRHRHNATTLMHHKFVVIDKCVVMTGSLNWTMQAFCGNWDNLIVTTRPPIVKSFLKEFNRVWKIME